MKFITGHAVVGVWGCLAAVIPGIPITVNGEEIENPLNQEVVTIRGVVKGEYIVNLHYYASETGKPLDVNVRLVKVNPSLEVIYYGTVKMEKAGSEKTAFRFNNKFRKKSY